MHSPRGAEEMQGDVALVGLDRATCEFRGPGPSSAFDLALNFSFFQALGSCERNASKKGYILEVVHGISPRVENAARSWGLAPHIRRSHSLTHL